MYKAMIAALGIVLLTVGCSAEPVDPVVATEEAQQAEYDNAAATSAALWNETYVYVPSPTPTSTPVPTPIPMFSFPQEHTLEADELGLQYVVGVLQYNHGRQLRYVEVTCQVMYRGERVADAIANALGMRNHSQWKFNAMLLEPDWVSQWDDIDCYAYGQAYY